MSTDKKISQLTSGAPAQAGDEYVVARSGANYKLTLTNIAASMPATTITSGDLTFSSTAQRITGDMSNATVANRLSFQTSTASSNTLIPILNTQASNGASVFQFYNNNDTTNNSYAQIGIGGSTLQIVSEKNGTGSYFPIIMSTGGSERVRIDTSGNVGIGGTTATAFVKCQINGTLPTSGTLSIGFSQDAAIPSGTTTLFAGFNNAAGTQAASFTLVSYAHYRASQGTFGAGSAVTNQFGYLAESTITGATNNYGFYGNIASGSNRWNFYAAGTASNYMAGRLGVGISPETYTSYRVSIQAASGANACLLINDNASATTQFIWNNAASGDNIFVQFGTDGGATTRGSIDYNRGGGLVRYNTTSDYRAKTIIGPVTNSGELVDALKVYVGKMNGATVERPMLIAHEAQEVAPYAVSGEKDAVDKDGNPVYQQIDVSSLVPLLIAEVKSLRQRVAELEAK